MKIFSILAGLFLLLICSVPATVTAKESATTLHIGKPVMCLTLSRIDETIILDDQTILIKMIGNALYLNRLPQPCYGLKTGDGFGYDTSIDKLCKQDIITVLSSASVVGNHCGLGEFYPLFHDGTTRQAVKALRNGGLEKLVKENAFSE